MTAPDLSPHELAVHHAFFTAPVLAGLDFAPEEER